MNRLQLYVLVLVLTVAGLGLFLFKVLALGFPLATDAETRVWTLQARFTIDARLRPVKAVLQIPKDPPGHVILDENFVSRRYGLAVVDENDRREAQWAIRRATGRQTLYYRAVVTTEIGRRASRRPPPFPEKPELEEPFRTALETVAEEVEDESADVSSYTARLLQRLNDPAPDENVDLLLSRGRSRGRRVELAVDVLAAAGIPARVAYGLPLNKNQRYAAFVPWLEVHDGDRWRVFHPTTGARGLPRDVFIWWTGDEPLIRVQGASNPEVELSVWRDVTSALDTARRRADLEHSAAVEFSLLALPIQIQAVYGVLLLVPLGAFIMVLLRNVVGIKTFGTFMPILIALAFRETRLLWGVLLFSLVMAIGLAIRFYLERLRLLLTPRLASVLILVVLVLAMLSILSHKLGFETGLSIALFPLVILVMSIERMSIVWEERGAGEALTEGTGTLLVAIFAYAIMNLDHVQHLVFVFPELLLVVLAATLLLGRYSGYRLLELTRFRTLADV